MTDTLNDCRRDFEQWYRRFYGHDAFANIPGTEVYMQKSVQGAWQSWKACWELQDARIKGAIG